VQIVQLKVFLSELLLRSRGVAGNAIAPAAVAGMLTEMVLQSSSGRKLNVAIGTSESVLQALKLAQLRPQT
jgi:hypothetical protein